MSDVTLRDITHRYDSEDVLKHIELTIPSGCLYTLLGPSGCGKTTLLRILAGFIVPTEGRVLIGENDVTSLPCEKRNMGVVFQNYALFPNMTVRENISYGLKVRGMSRNDVKNRADRYIELTGLGAYVDRAIQDLSGGQQQRVAVARALAIEPQMLLLDEPMSNLDVALRAKMREEIRSIQQQTGITTLFITHDQQEALSLSDYVAVMRDGEVLQTGTPEEVYNHPNCSFVASFVGTTNTLGGAQLRPEQLVLTHNEHARDGVTVCIERVSFTGPSYEYTAYDANTNTRYIVVEKNYGTGRAWSVGDVCTLAPDTNQADFCS